MEYSGVWGKLIHEKNQKQKISWHCPFKGAQKSIPPASVAWRAGTTNMVFVPAR